MMVLTSVGAPGTAAHQQQCSNMSFLVVKQRIKRKTRFLTCWVKAVVSEQDLGGGVVSGVGEEDTPHRNKGYISGISRDLEFPSH